MKERPILFSAPMVRALLNGSKTQTRRIMKRQPYMSQSNPPRFSDIEIGDLFICPDYFGPGKVIAECETIGTYHCMGQQKFAEKHSPYGVAGDRLWVRETWAQPAPLDPGPTVYRADYPACVPAGFENIPPADSIRWKPSIHMPRALSRITLEITGVRVDRLQHISEADAIAEGIQLLNGRFTFNDGLHESRSARDSFAALWESINGADSWESNPWVWVIEFARITTEDGK